MCRAPPALTEDEWLAAMATALPPEMAVLRRFDLASEREFDARRAYVADPPCALGGRDGRQI